MIRNGEVEAVVSRISQSQFDRCLHIENKNYDLDNNNAKIYMKNVNYHFRVGRVYKFQNLITTATHQFKLTAASVIEELPLMKPLDYYIDRNNNYQTDICGIINSIPVHQNGIGK